MLTQEQLDKVIDPIVDKVESMTNNRVSAREGGIEDVHAVYKAVAKRLIALSK